MQCQSMQQPPTSPNAASTSSLSSPSSPSAPLPSGPSSSFPNVATGSVIHSTLLALRVSSSAVDCSSTVVSPPAASNNNHFHLHLHNYLASHSTTVAMSSRMVACDRAIETLRLDSRLFADPLAAELAGTELMEKALSRQRELEERRRAAAQPRLAEREDGAGEQRPRPRLSAETDPEKAPRVAIRTRFFDDFLLSIASSHPLQLRQLMLLGCGMDARAFRLDCLRTEGQLCCTVYELDTEAVMRYKNSTIAAMRHCPPILCQRRIAVHADIATSANSSVPYSLSFVTPADEAVASPASSPHTTLPLASWASSLVSQHGFHLRVPSVWLLEACLMYLTPEAQHAALLSVSLLSCLGSFLAFSHINRRALLNVQRTGQAWGMLSSTFQCCMDDAMLQQLLDWGWQLVKLTQPGAPDANYGRWLAPVHALDDPTHGVTLYACLVKVANTRQDGREIDQSMDVAATLDMTAQPAEEVVPSSQPALQPDKAEAAEAAESAAAASAPASAPAPAKAVGDKEEARLQSERVIDSWNERAVAYQALVQRFHLFSTIAQRLVDLLPLPIASSSTSTFLSPFRVVDLACGTGCVTDALLARFPLAQVYLLDPSPAMLNIARRSIAERYGSGCLLSCEPLRAEDAALLSSDLQFRPATAVLCSASMHLMREEAIFPQVAPLLAAGGCFLYNVWGHAWADTQQQEEQESWKWKELINQALREHGEPALYCPPQSPPAASTRCSSQVEQAAQASGLLVDELLLDADEVSCDMMLEFEAMSERWLGSIAEAKRRQVMDRARELGRAATFRAHTVRIRVSKPAAATEPPPPLVQ